MCVAEPLDHNYIHAHSAGQYGSTLSPLELVLHAAHDHHCAVSLGFIAHAPQISGIMQISA